METLVDRVTTAFREQMWRTMRLPGSEALRHAAAERIWIRLLQRGFAAVARDPELHLYLAMTGELQSPKRDLLSFLFERARQRHAYRYKLCDVPSVSGMAERAIHDDICARLERLPPRLRMVLIARRRDRLSYEEIGQQLGCSAQWARRTFVLALRTYILPPGARR